MNGWGPSDDGFATREATIADGIEWARLQKQLQEQRESEEFCVDCYEEIPVARRLLVKGCQRCVECQGKWDSVMTSAYNRRGSKDSQLR